MWIKLIDRCLIMQIQANSITVIQGLGGEIISVQVTSYLEVLLHPTLEFDSV
jgi:hypothetical protein